MYVYVYVYVYVYTLNDRELQKGRQRLLSGQVESCVCRWTHVYHICISYAWKGMHTFILCYNICHMCVSIP